MFTEVAATLLVMVTASHVVQTEATNAWFLHNYLPAARRIERVYGNLSMHATTEFIHHPDAPQSRETRYWAYDGRYRVDTRHEPFLDRDLSLIAGHDLSAVIWRGRSGRNRLSCRTDFSTGDAVLQQIRVVMPMAFAPWCCCQQSVEHLFLKENARITASSVSADPMLGRICNVSWTYLDRGACRDGNQFRFAMDRSWVLLSVSLDLNETSRLEGRFTYGDEEISGVPMIRIAEYWCDTSCGRTTHKRMTRQSFAIMSSASDVFDPSREQIKAALSSSVAPGYGQLNLIAPGLIGLGAIAIGLFGWWRLIRRNSCPGTSGSMGSVLPLTGAPRTDGAVQRSQAESRTHLRDSGDTDV